MSPPTNYWPGVAMAFGCGLLSTASSATTQAIPEPVGLQASASGSQAPAMPSLLDEFRRTRVERIRSLRGKYRGLAPTVDEYLAAKQFESD